MVTFKELQNVIRPSSLYPSLSFSIPHNQSILKSHMLIWQTLTFPDFSTSVPFGIIFPLPRIPFPPLLHVKIRQNLKLYFFFSQSFPWCLCLKWIFPCSVFCSLLFSLYRCAHFLSCVRVVLYFLLIRLKLFEDRTRSYLFQHTVLLVVKM